MDHISLMAEVLSAFWADRLRAALSFLQSWLFFGTIKEVFGLANVTISQDDYIDGDVVSTKHLHGHLQRWKSEESNQPGSVKMAHFKSMRFLLRQFFYMVRTFEEPTTSPGPISVVTFSIHMLAPTLAFAAQRIYDDRVWRPRLISRFLLAQFDAAGWCKYQAARASNLLEPVAAYFAFQLGPPASNRGHDNCSQSLCLVNQVNEQDYETKHALNPNGYCACHVLAEYHSSSSGELAELFWEPNIDKIADILRRGGIPLVSLAGGYDQVGALGPEIVEYEDGMHYVAFSHIWTDGLGNPHRNALPLCQLQRLRRYIAQTPGYTYKERIYFWMDTLGVPLQPNEARKAGIRSMPRVYGLAHSTLVLDASLLAYKVPSSVEFPMRILLSTWSQRLWTFQEGLLAKRIFFQFSDGQAREPLDIMKGYMVSAWAERKNDPTHMEFLFGMCIFESLSWLMWENPFTPENYHRSSLASTPFATIWNGLAWRTTSKPTDEAVCVGALLGLDVGEIIDSEETGDSVKTLPRFCKTLPPELIFETVERQGDDGFRWAPLRLCFTGHRSVRRVWPGSKGLAHLILDEDPSHSGLSVQYPGVMLPAEASSRIAGGRRPSFEIYQPDAQGAQLYVVSLGVHNLGLRTRAELELFLKTVRLSEGLAIILQTPLDDSDECGNELVVGVLVSIRHTTDESLYVRHLCIVNLVGWSIVRGRPR